MQPLLDFWSAHQAQISTLALRLALAGIIYFACRLLSLLARKTISAACNRIDRLDVTLAPILSSVASLLIYAIGLVAILDRFGVNANSLVAVIGAAGLAIGLALKETLSNIASGIMLLILRPFRAGDFIDCAGRSGTVQAVNLFTVTLQTPDGLYISLPNSTVWSADIVNYTRNGKRRIDLTVGISYADDLDRGLQVLSDLAAAEKRFLPDPAPTAFVSALADSAVNLTLRGWTTVDDYWPTRFDLTRQAKLSIEAAGLSIPFPQRDVHLFPAQR